jgi:hypothetical protein
MKNLLIFGFIAILALGMVSCATSPPPQSSTTKPGVATNQSNPNTQPGNWQQQMEVIEPH